MADNPYIPTPPPAGHPAAVHHAGMVSAMKKITSDRNVSNIFNQVKSYNRKSPFGDFQVKDAIESHPSFREFTQHKDAFDKAMKHTPSSSAMNGKS